jgi:8-oxo-dGTP diphosphatase
VTLQSPDIVEVSVAVILRPDGSFLLAKRPDGKAYAGYWEFPGGKIEPDETGEEALQRELREELGMEATVIHHWLTRRYDYEHARVRLHFFRVKAWEGEPHPHEGQILAWQQPHAIRVSPLLPANGPILASLKLPPILAISQAEALGQDIFLKRLDAALVKGLRLIQLREKAMPEKDFAALARAVIKRARPYCARVLVNSDENQAASLAADGLHLSAKGLMALETRPAFSLVSASCHDAVELARAAELGLDFALLSPVLPTASHPGAPTLGWARFSELIRDTSLPVYALGGLIPEHLTTAQRHGAHGIAMLRAAWE